MPILSRPAKQGGATTYQEKVAQGYKTILASEADADLNTIYDAWNTGVDAVNIQPGAITADKLAPNQIGPRELADNLPGDILAGDSSPGIVRWRRDGEGQCVRTKMEAGQVVQDRGHQWTGQR